MLSSYLCSLNEALLNLQGKDDVYDRMLLDYFFSYHQFIHLLCRVAINCEKFTETLVKMSKYEGETAEGFCSVITVSTSPLRFTFRIYIVLDIILYPQIVWFGVYDVLQSYLCDCPERS